MRRSAGRSLALLLVALAALVVAGCGGEASKSEYEQKVQAVYADVQEAFRATGGGRTFDDLAERTEAAQDALRSAAEELDDVDAPRAVEEQNEELVQAFRGYADDLDTLIDAARADDSDRVAAFQRSIAENRWIRQIQEVAEQMTVKGYDLGDIAQGD